MDDAADLSEFFPPGMRLTFDTLLIHFSRGRNILLHRLEVGLFLWGTHPVEDIQVRDSGIKCSQRRRFDGKQAAICTADAKSSLGRRIDNLDFFPWGSEIGGVYSPLIPVARERCSQTVGHSMWLASCSAGWQRAQIPLGKNNWHVRKEAQKPTYAQDRLQYRNSGEVKMYRVRVICR